MAQQDVMPLTSSLGGHLRMEGYNRAAAPTYRIGEWTIITVAADSTVDEIAAAVGGAAYDGTLHRVAADDGAINPAVPAGSGSPGTRFVSPPNTAKMDSMYVLTPDTEFVTRNAYNGNDTNIGPAGAFASANIRVGATAGVHRAATGDHGIDVAQGGLVITRLLDAQGNDSAFTGNAVDRVAFRVDL